MNSENGVTTFRIIANEDATLNTKMQGMLRRIPDAFLTPRILVCEGITEVGFVRSLDEKLQENEKFYMASRCVSYADGKGGAEALSVAERFHDLGFDVAVLVDNDRPEDETKKRSLILKGIPVFSWGKGQCLETALLPLFSVEALCELLQWESEKKDATWDEIIEQGYASQKYLLNENLQETDLMEIAKISSEKGFFKRVAGGEELGKMFFSRIINLSQDSKAVKVVDSIINWINYGEKKGLSK